MASYSKRLEVNPRNVCKPLPSHVIFSYRERCLICGSWLQADLDVMVDHQGTLWRKYTCESAHACTSVFRSEHEPTLRIEGA